MQENKEFWKMSLLLSSATRCNRAAAEVPDDFMFQMTKEEMQEWKSPYFVPLLPRNSRDAIAREPGLGLNCLK